MKLQELADRAICAAQEARVAFAARLADRRLRPIVLAGALSVGDRDRLNTLLEEARRICAESADRVGVPATAVQGRSAEVRLLLAFAAMKPSSRTVVVPVAVIVGGD